MRARPSVLLAHAQLRALGVVRHLARAQMEALHLAAWYVVVHLVGWWRWCVLPPFPETLAMASVGYQSGAEEAHGLWSDDIW